MGVCNGTDGDNLVVRSEEVAFEVKRSLIARPKGVSGVSYALVADAPVGGLELKKSMVKKKEDYSEKRKWALLVVGEGCDWCRCVTYKGADAGSETAKVD